jgi:hypothetical protein
MPYGQGQELMQQQQAEKMAGPTPSAPSAPSLAALTQGPAITPLNAPTQFPDRPIGQNGIIDTASLNLPPAVPGELDDAIQALQALYLQNPRNEDIRRVFETMEREGRLG